VSTQGSSRGPHRVPGRTIGGVFAPSDSFPGPASLARLSGLLGVGAFGVFVAIGFATRLGEPGRAATGTLIALAGAVPLFLGRSRFPLGWAAVATAGVVVINNADSRAVSWFAVIVLGAWCVLSGGIRVGVTYWIAGVLLFGGEWFWALRDPGWGPWTAGLTVTVLAAVLIRHEFVLVERLHAAQGDLAERSRAEERLRIAHELHDVIAHSLTVSLLHVTSARLAVEHDPADAARALAEAERLGRQSLAEVRATVGLLADPGQPVAPPVPGAGQLAGLVQQMRDAGADVTLRMDVDAAEVASITGSTIYRIVQEALTNATRHAPGAAVTVAVTASGGRVELDVESAGRPGRGSGLGMESMQERARALGGTCTAGPGGRGWLVHASLPVEFERGLDVT
jgi:signal transduction histidine kinase